jgi:hypothetical protein
LGPLHGDGTVVLEQTETTAFMEDVRTGFGDLPRRTTWTRHSVLAGSEPTVAITPGVRWCRLRQLQIVAIGPAVHLLQLADQDAPTSTTRVLAMPLDLLRHDMLIDLRPVNPGRIQSIVDELLLPPCRTTRIRLA